jgi:hypothetical protein
MRGPLHVDEVNRPDIQPFRDGSMPVLEHLQMGRLYEVG